MDTHHSSFRLLCSLSPLCNCNCNSFTSAWPNSNITLTHFFLLLFTHLSCFSWLCYKHSWDPLAGSVYKNILLTFTPFRLFIQLLASLCHVVTTFCFMCSVFSRFAPSVCAVRVVEPLNPGSPGTLSGRMTSPCVMTVPNSLLKVCEKQVESKMLFTGEEDVV